MRKTYQAKLAEYSEEYGTVCDQIEQLKETTRSVHDIMESTMEKMEKINKRLVELYSFDVKEGQLFIWKKFTPLDLNDLIDKIRYKEFWLAAHYYEGKWHVT